jgi:gliding motility-associated-like protein
VRYIVVDSIYSGGNTRESFGMVILIRYQGNVKPPRGFSPNGDGVNDEYIIEKSEKFPASVLTIYNRYGDKVWENKAGVGYQNDFIGRDMNGNNLLDGTYFYIFNHNKQTYTNEGGSVTIQR